MRIPWRARGQAIKLDFELDYALEMEGCPLCHLGAQSDGRHFFWFFNENYYEPHTLDALERSLGFCLDHTDILMRVGAGRHQLAAVFEVLTRRVRAALSPGRSEVATLRSPAPCPVCQSRHEQEERGVISLSELLGTGGWEERYGHPGLLCAPHIRRLAPRLEGDVLRSVLGLHVTAMTRNAAAISDLESELRADAPEGGHHQDVGKRLRSALRLVVGHERETGAYPRFDEDRTPAAPSGSLRDFVAACRTEACPVCLDQRRVWIDWMRWLEAGSLAFRPVADLLPTCPAHVYAVVHNAAPAHAARTTGRVLARTLAAMTTTHDTLAAPIGRCPSGHGRLRGDQNDRRGRHRRALEIITSALDCPICDRLTMAADRSTALFLALLEDDGHGAALREGYGLCLQHFGRALAAGSPGNAMVQLARMERARLALLNWELEEALRKVAWEFRPEPPGEEQTAWKRALLRFSGSLGTAWS